MALRGPSADEIRRELFKEITSSNTNKRELNNLRALALKAVEAGVEVDDFVVRQAMIHLANKKDRAVF
jgi:hypothetical protein